MCGRGCCSESGGGELRDGDDGGEVLPAAGFRMESMQNERRCCCCCSVMGLTAEVVVACTGDEGLPDADGGVAAAGSSVGAGGCTGGGEDAGEEEASEVMFKLEAEEGLISLKVSNDSK